MSEVNHPTSKERCSHGATYRMLPDRRLSVQDACPYCEIERLRVRCAELELFNVGLATESEQRRAALEEITWHPKRAYEIAQQALSVASHASETECDLCASGMNSFTDPDTGTRIHARNGTVTPCSAPKAPETFKRRIREDIKVGSTLFRVGVMLRIVLERIERGFEYHTDRCSEKADGTS